MRVGVIGSGHVGATAARLLAAAGHDVVFANSRGPDTLADLVDEIGERARAETVAGAAGDGDVVLLALPFGGYGELPAEQLAGKVVIDAGNYYPGRDGHDAALDDDETTSSEELAALVPGARVVKAFNTLFWEHLRDRGGEPDRIVLFVAGDDADAKATVAALIEDIGFAPVDVGDLAGGGRKLQPGGPLSGALVPESEAAARV